jgi:dienelactone hydrolase
LSNITEALRAAWAWLCRAVTPSKSAWRGAAVALFVFWGAMVVWFASVGVVPHFSVEKFAGLIGLFGLLALVSAAALLIVWLAGLLDPTYRFAFFLAVVPTALFMMVTWEDGTEIATPVWIIGLSLLCGSGLVLWTGSRRIGTILYALVGAGLVGFFLYELVAPPPALNSALKAYHLKGQTLALPDPGKPGPYKVSTFTYGSGADRHRPEYAANARFKTQSVDGAKLDTQWTGFGGWLRTAYWGFDASHMPRNGRVWMPDGAGPFPLVLIVHGNHEMEDYSDPGYAYLGELLASQGFIAVSVDENFINSSLADYADVFHLRSGSENRARGWMLLEHLALWRAWNADAQNPLHGKIDMDRIALVGHSRGGEAVAIASAFNKLDRYPDDATLAFDFHFHIRAIAAIAPVDGQYKPRERPTPMRDQNYFVIQGNWDGDLTSFMGSSQYSRARFSGKTDAFKASLYVNGANHGQFNTSWGRNDFGIPYKFLLDERPIMDPNAQRRIAKVYLTAFLQMTLNGKDGYRPLFEDARNGAAWLPDDYLVNNYADSQTQWIANYEEDLNPTTGSMEGVTIAGDGLSVWREDYVSLKDSTLDTYVALLGWDDRVHKNASYTFSFTTPPALTPAADLVFSASQAEIDTVPKTAKVKGSRSNADTAALDWDIVLTDSSGQEARLPLSHDQVLYPQLKSETRHGALFDRIPRSEIVMRRFHFPLRDFLAANPRLDIAHLKEIRFAFDKNSRGAIALDDVGFSPERP